MAGGKGEHVDIVRESRFNRQRANTDTLRDNCGSDGYVFTKDFSGVKKAAGQCQFHHVLPIETTDDANILNGMKSLEDEEKDFIHKCMAKTTWDTNEQPNLIGLPTKNPYYNADKKIERNPALAAADLLALDPESAEFGALPNLPCHMNDHNLYNKEVIDMLDSELWETLRGERVKCKDKGKSIRKLLMDQSRTWKSKLNARGKRHGGAAECWVNRLTTKRTVWHIPLSMAVDPEWTEPPPKAPKTGLRAWCKKIFDWVP